VTIFDSALFKKKEVSTFCIIISAKIENTTSINRKSIEQILASVSRRNSGAHRYGHIWLDEIATFTETETVVHQHT